MAKSGATTRRKDDGGELMPKTAKLSASIGIETYRRLVVHALYAGLSQGAFLDRLIDTHCRELRVQQNPPRGRPSDDSVDRLEIAGSVMESAA